MDSTNDQRTIQPDDMLRFRFLDDAQLSPDGRRVAYTVSHVDLEKDRDILTIWLLTLETGETRQLTGGMARDTNPRWSPDGRRIAFVREPLDAGRGASKKGKKAQIYLIAVDGGEPRLLTDASQGVGGGPEWSPDGNWIAFTAGPAGEPRDPQKPYRVTRHIYRMDGMGYLDDTVHDIYIIPAEGGEAQQLTRDACHNTAPVWSPDGQEILFTTTFWPDSARIEPVLRVVNLEGEIRELVKAWGSGRAAAWTPDGARVVFVGNPLGVASFTHDNLWVINSQVGTPECRTERLEGQVGGGLQGDMPVRAQRIPRLFVTEDGANAVVRVQEGGAIHIYQVALDGAETCVPLVTGERFNIPVSMAEERLLYASGTINDPPDLFIADLDGSNARRLTQLNAALLAGFRLPLAERIVFPSSDGVDVEGWFLKPPVGKAPYPTVLYIHGGPASAFGHIFSFDFQMLTGAGYAVLLVNFRGSTGYGDAFSNKIIGDLGHWEYEDLMAGVDHVVEKGLADPDRLGVCGLSYGGYMSCWIVGQTDRFKAAVPENAVTNRASAYGVMDIGMSFTPKMLGGLPHEIPEVYRRCSPITYAHRCTTPTLLIQGEADYRCSADGAEQFYAVLKASGCTVEMLRLPHSPHVGSIEGPLPIRRAQNEALLGWMNRYVLGRE
jgi:dipeptidyl aminopeptidase/acylaminoacyl peptidase